MKPPPGQREGFRFANGGDLWYNTLKPNRADPRRPCRRNHRKVIGMIEQVTIVGMGALGILYGDRLSRYLERTTSGSWRRESGWSDTGGEEGLVQRKEVRVQFSDGTDGRPSC